jgi:hypothetical protein
MSSETRLTSIAIGWSPDHSYPYLDRFPFLHTLRLSIHRDDSGECPRNLGAPGTYASLTTLVLHGQLECYYHRRVGSCLFNHFNDLNFPNLRMVSLQEVSMKPRELYHFISKHPSLVEVNVRHSYIPKLSLAFFKKLIDGTGVWKQTTSTQTLVLDQPFSLAVPGFAWTVSFAFSRKLRPLQMPDTTRSAPPIYETTAFALDGPNTYISFPAVMSDLDFQRSSHSIEHFSLGCETTEVDFVTFMVGSHLHSKRIGLSCIC